MPTENNALPIDVTHPTGNGRRVTRTLSLLLTGLLPIGLTMLTPTPHHAQDAAVQPTAHEDGHDHPHGEGKGHHGAHAAHGERGGHHPGKGHHGHQLHHDFSDAERWAAIFDDPERVTWQRPEEVVRHMDIADGATVVDLGAGTGFFLPYLAEAAANGKVMGLDPEDNLVEHMRARVEEADLDHVEIRRIPFDDPQLAAGSVDRLLIVNTWHHIEQRGDYASKLLAALREDGKLYIVDFTKDSPSGPPKQHRLEPQEVIDELAAGGFEAEVIDETLPRQYIVVGRRPKS